MVTTVKELAGLLEAKDADAFMRARDFLVDHPDQASALVLASAANTESSTIIDVALAMTPESELAQLAAAAVAAVEHGNDPNDSQAGQIIDELVYQAPQALVPFDPVLWERYPLHFTGPWLGASDPATVDRFAGLLNDPDVEERKRGFRALVGSHSERGWRAALDAVGTTIADDWWAQACIELGGIAPDGDEIRLLYTPQPCHLEFVPPLVHTGAWWSNLPHPTWDLQSEVVGSGVFGGSAPEPCAICGYPLHRLVTLAQRPDWIDMPAQVVTCMNCLPWATDLLYFRHTDESVGPTGPLPPPQAPDWVLDPLPEVDLRLRRTPDRWAWQPWATRENLNRVGGEASWVQDARYPECPDCGIAMSFVMQIDSLSSETVEVAWGSGGLLYVCWCHRCAISATFAQWT